MPINLLENVRKYPQVDETEAPISINVPGLNSEWRSTSAQQQTLDIAAMPIVKTAVPTASAGPPTPIMPPPLTGKGEQISYPSTQNWEIYGAGESHNRIVARGRPGDSALQFKKNALGKNALDIGANMPVGTAIADGDALVLAFFARTVSAESSDGQGKISVRLNPNVASYPGFGDHSLAIGTTWKLFQIRTQANIDISEDEAVLAFHLAGAKQVVEIGHGYGLRKPAAK